VNVIRKSGYSTANLQAVGVTGAGFDLDSFMFALDIAAYLSEKGSGTHIPTSSTSSHAAA
jgi:hypothetical protein